MVVVDASTRTILAVNTAARQMLWNDESGFEGLRISDVSHPDDINRLEAAIGDREVSVRAPVSFRHRFLGGGVVAVDVTVVGIAGAIEEQRLALLELRPVATQTGLSDLLELLADNPDGDTLLAAILSGPLARFPVRMATICSVDHPNRAIIQLGTHGMDEEMQRAYRLTPINNMHPGGFAVLNSKTVWLGMHSVAERFPLVARRWRGEPWFDTAEVLASPVTSRESVIGCVFFLSETGFPRTPEFSATIESIVGVVAPWLLSQREPEPAHVRTGPRNQSPLMITDRERTIVRFVGEGRTNADIALRLGYSEATVRGDLGRLARMLGVKGRREIARRVEELGL